MLEQLSAWRKERASINFSTQESFIFEENLKSGVFGYENLPGNKDSGYSDTTVLYNVLTPGASYHDEIESLNYIHKSSSLSNDETDVLTRDTQNENYKTNSDIYLSPSSFLSLENEEKNFTLNQSNDILYPESDLINIDHLANKLSSCANLKLSSSYMNGSASNNGLENMNNECYENLISKKILNASCVRSNENEKNTQVVNDHLDGNPASKQGCVTRQFSINNEDSKSLLSTCQQTATLLNKIAIYPSDYLNYSNNDENYVNALESYQSPTKKIPELYQSSTKKFPEINHSEEIFINSDTLLQKARTKSLLKPTQIDEGEYMILDPNKTNGKSLIQKESVKLCITFLKYWFVLWKFCIKKQKITLCFFTGINYDKDAPELPPKMMSHRRCSEPGSNIYACTKKQQPNRSCTQVVQFPEVNKCAANEISKSRNCFQSHNFLGYLLNSLL